MLCPKCNNELNDDSQFCNKCGAKTVSNDEATEKTGIMRHKGKLVAIVGLLVVVAFVLIYINNSVGSFESALSDNKYSEAMKIYDEKIKGNSEKEKEVNDLLNSEVEKIKEDFLSKKTDYKDAIARLETIQKTGLSNDVYSAISEINRINDSIVAFKKGKDYLENKNYREAMSEFKKVISEDENYQQAQNYINSSIKDYKTSILNESKSAANNKEFEKAISLLSEAETLLPNDSEIAIAKANIVQGLKNNQEVSVISTGLNTDWVDDYYVTVVVKNNTNKVVKKYTVGYMGFDKNNYPVKSGWLSPDYLKEGYSEANIQPGKTSGSDGGWQLTGGFDKSLEAVRFLACVKEVEYYDGSKWINPYYSYWVEQYKEKPLK